MSLFRFKFKLYTILYRLVFRRKYGHFGSNVRVYRPLRVDCSRNIYLKDDVVVGANAWLAAVPLSKNEKAELIIEEGAILGNFNHVYSVDSIKIGRNVLTADRVYISDNTHSYEDVNLPIREQAVKKTRSVSIGEGAWIGENVCVLGASVGANSIIGANSVVTKDIPDYSVAAGVPASIIKQYCFEKKEWIRC